MNEDDASRMVTAAVVIVIMTVLTVLVVLGVRRVTTAKGEKEQFLESGLNAVGETLDCRTMDTTLLRSAPQCGIDLPATDAGQFCVGDTCLDARDIRDLGRLTSRFSEYNAMLDSKFDALDRRLDAYARNRARAFGGIEDRLDTAASERKKAFASLGRQADGLRDDLRANNGVGARGGQRVYNHRGYRVHVFTRSGSLVVSNGGTADVLVVGGGGGGGHHGYNQYAGGGGGGAGALVWKTGVSLRSSSTVAVKVGEGGKAGNTNGRSSAGTGYKGGDSEAFGLFAEGGGGGGNFYARSPSTQARMVGGSGGGGGYNGGRGTPEAGGDGSSGYDGGAGGTRAGGGGGGATGAGREGRGGQAGDAGDGKDLSFAFGRAVGHGGKFAGGGGGGSRTRFPVGKGGEGGGGDGGNSEVRASVGRPGTGAGGGGGNSRSGAGDGGSGVVLVRYPLGVLRGSPKAEQYILRDEVHLRRAPSDLASKGRVMFLPKFYSLSYDVYVESTTGDWGQIVRFNDDTDDPAHNYPRPIAHWLTPGDTRLHAKAATENYHNRGPNTSSLPTGRWVRVKIEVAPATRGGHDHVYRVYVDGRREHSESSPHANLHGEMRVFVGGNTGGRYHVANARVRDMVLRPSEAVALLPSSVRVDRVPLGRELLTTLVLPKFFTFSYEVYVHGTTGGWGQIVRFNPVQDPRHNYPRPIAHWLTPGDTRLHAKAATENNKNRGPDTPNLPTGEWTRVRVDIAPSSSSSDNADHVYRVSLNGRAVHESASNDPGLHGRMWVWLGGTTDGKYDRAKATVRNMVLRPYDDDGDV